MTDRLEPARRTCGDVRIEGVLRQIVDNLAQLRFSRTDEAEADRIGLEIAARAGFDPRSGLTLFDKMDQASRSRHLEFLSSHPGGPNRIRAIQAQLPSVLPFYQATLQGNAEPTDADQ